MAVSSFHKWAELILAGIHFAYNKVSLTGGADHDNDDKPAGGFPIVLIVTISPVLTSRERIIKMVRTLRREKLLRTYLKIINAPVG